MVKKKGKLAFRSRFYTLTSDGNLYSARDDQTNKTKHIVDFEEQTSVLSVRERDLIITGQNDQGFVNGFCLVLQQSLLHRILPPDYFFHEFYLIALKYRPVSIKLRFNDAEERAAWARNPACS